MINPQLIDISSLPWLPLDARSAFPKQPAIYFAIDSKNRIQYIGRSLNPKSRWSIDILLSLKAEEDVKHSYLSTIATYSDRTPPHYPHHTKIMIQGKLEVVVKIKYKLKYHNL